MKKQILFLLASSVSIFTWAQITITRSDFFNTGEVVVEGYDTSIAGSTSPGSTGANQTWDFSSLYSANYSDTTWVSDASADPNAPVGSNMRFLTSQGDTSFLEASSTGISIFLNFGAPFTAPIKITYFKFPITYNTEYTEPSVLTKTGTPAEFGNPKPGIDSVQLNLFFDIHAKCDGYGSLKAAAGAPSYQNTLRLTIQQNAHTVAWVKGPLTLGQWIIAEQDTQPPNKAVVWLASNGKFPVMNMNLDSSGFVSDVSWVTSAMNGLNTLGASSGLNVYPNPATDKLTISSNVLKGGNAEIILEDLQGRQVRHESISSQNSGDFTLNVSDLPSGLYICNITSGSNTIQKKVFINR